MTADGEDLSNLNSLARADSKAETVYHLKQKSLLAFVVRVL